MGGDVVGGNVVGGNVVGGNVPGLLSCHSVRHVTVFAMSQCSPCHSVRHVTVFAMSSQLHDLAQSVACTSRKCVFTRRL